MCDLLSKFFLLEIYHLTKKEIDYENINDNNVYINMFLFKWMQER